MHIGIIGAGNIGTTTARLFVDAGHQVAISNSRGPESLVGLVAALGPNARAMTVDDAAAFGDVVLVAIPFGRYETLPSARLAGKIVVDAMNYYAQRDGRRDFGDRTSSELVAQHLRGARLVKAFNTMSYQTLATAGRHDGPTEERLALFVAGDDPEAKRVIARLIEALGFAPVDTGSLRDGGRRQQSGAPIYNQPLAVAQARERLATGA
ncbi:MAG: NAD(P)-binding domain-containing protein [Chloroflexota bacterium]|nr:NAD(P)-binding domain-containing protein [Chloroflexota bacterium]